jgi:cyclopropane fatty-acyl-phospholipid synthase-like methyltransferase
MARKKPDALPSWQEEYDRLKATLAQAGWISEGYVQDRGPGAGGPCFQWTRKVKGKTVSVALSKEQYAWLKAAIANWRTIQISLREMQRLSRKVLFTSVPDLPRRKRPTKKTLGLT